MKTSIFGLLLVNMIIGAQCYKNSFAVQKRETQCDKNSFAVQKRETQCYVPTMSLSNRAYTSNQAYKTKFKF